MNLTLPTASGITEEQATQKYQEAFVGQCSFHFYYLSFFPSLNGKHEPNMAHSKWYHIGTSYREMFRSN